MSLFREAGHIRRIPTIAVVFAASAVLGVGLNGCGGGIQSEGYPGTGEGARAEVKSNALTVRWTTPLNADFPGRFVPVEYATVALDSDAQRVLVGSATGVLWAFTLDGKRIFRYHAQSPIESAPALDPSAGTIYLATAGGTLDAIRASDGKRIWRTNLESPVRRPPLVSRDAIYIVTAANSVIALARAKGEVLWRYRRDMSEGFSITGNAGLLAADGKLFTAFSDGVVVSLDPSDGRLVWERDTSLDVEEKGGDQSPLLDVDTTPIKVGNEIFVASFSAGVYALSPVNGAILWRVPELTSVTAMASDGNMVVFSSSENGVVCMDSATHEILWKREVKRGSPGEIMISDGLVFVGESEGGFLALSTKTGREQARLESGHGFSAAASIIGRRGFLVSNGGTLFAFSY